MNKTLLWRIIIVAAILGLIISGISRSVHLNRLADTLINGDPEQQVNAATELMKRDKLFEKTQRMDSTDRIKIMDVIAKIPGELTVKQTLPMFKDTEAKLRTNTQVIEVDNKIRGLQYYQDEKTKKTNAPLLKELQDKKAHLTKLQNDEVELHTKIVDVLKVLAKNEINTLVPEMKNPDANVGVGVKDTLVAIGAKTIPYMKEAAFEEDLRGHAFEVLSRVGEESIPILIELLNYKTADNTKSQPIRMAAAGALGSIAKKGATMALIEATKDVEAVRRVAISSLCAIRDPRSIDTLVYVLTHTTDDGEVRARSATALSAIGGQKAITALVGALDDLDLKVQSSAITGLQLIGNAAVKPVAAAIASGNKQTAKSGAVVLERINSPEASNVLITLTKSSDPDIRASAAKGLGFQSNPRIDILVSLLSDSNGKVGDVAMDTLTNLGESVVPKLVSVINSEASDTSKYRAATILGRIGSPSVQPLIPLLQKGGESTKWAAYALGRTGDSRSKSILEKYMASADPNLVAIVQSAIHRP